MSGDGGGAVTGQSWYKYWHHRRVPSGPADRRAEQDNRPRVPGHQLRPLRPRVQHRAHPAGALPRLRHPGQWHNDVSKPKHNQLTVKNRFFLLYNKKTKFIERSFSGVRLLFEN